MTYFFQKSAVPQTVSFAATNIFMYYHIYRKMAEIDFLNA